MFNSWLHIIALVAYLGAIVGLGVMLLPSLSSVENHEDKVHFLARGLKFYNPLQVGALGLLLFSGAFQLTHLKAIYREMFLKQLGYSLAIKLTFAFLLVFFSVYQAMGIGHRFVRRRELGESITPSELDSVIRRLTGANWLILFLAFVTIWLGLRLQS
jgi:uncharacterized membrane protein